PAPARRTGALPGTAAPSGPRDRLAPDAGLRRHDLVPRRVGGGSCRNRRADEDLEARGEPRRCREPDRDPRADDAYVDRRVALRGAPEPDSPLGRARVARGPAGRPRGRPDGLGRDDQLVAAASAAPAARPAPPRARARDRRVPAGHGRGAGALRLRAYDLRSRSEGGPAGPRAGAAGHTAPTALARPSRPRWRGGRARSGAPGIAGARLPDRRAASRRPHAVGKERAQALRRRVRHALGRTGTRADGEHSRDRRPGAGARLLSVPGPCLASCVLRGPRRDAVRRRRDRCQDPAEPVRATADAATRIRPGGMGVDAGRDRAQGRAAPRPDPFRRRGRPDRAPRRLADAAAVLDRARWTRNHRGGVRGDRAGGTRRRRAAVRASDAALAVVRRTATLLGEAARRDGLSARVSPRQNGPGQASGPFRSRTGFSDPFLRRLLVRAVEWHARD